MRIYIRKSYETKETDTTTIESYSDTLKERRVFIRFKITQEYIQKPISHKCFTIHEYMCIAQKHNPCKTNELDFYFISW